MDADCAIIGAGPTGLYCATYLGRFNRNVIVFNGGKSRAEWIPTSHNYPGFPQGITGAEMIQLLRRQAEQYNAQIRDDRVCSIEGSDGRFVLKTDSTETRIRKIVFATGVKDIPPDIPDVNRFIGRTLRHCPICDAYEARGRRIVVIGRGNKSARQTIWLSHYTNDITLLTNDGVGHGGIDPQLLRILDLLKVSIVPVTISSIEGHDEMLGTIILEDGSKIENVFRGYSAMGLKANSEVARALGAELDSTECIKVDSHQRTNIKGAYAIGDVAGGNIAQIAVGMGHAAIAATDIHNSMLVI